MITKGGYTFTEAQVAFFKKYDLAAWDAVEGTGISVLTLLAQAAHESGWGTSQLATQAKNIFGKVNGIKADASWKGAKYGSYRAYDNTLQSMKDYVKFLQTNSRYKKIFLPENQNFNAQISIIAKAGYATDPNYESKVRAVATTLNELHQVYYKEVTGGGNKTIMWVGLALFILLLSESES